MKGELARLILEITLFNRVRIAEILRRVGTLARQMLMQNSFTILQVESYKIVIIAQGS